MIFMFSWISFLVILYGAYSFITNKPLDMFLDEETGGFISLGFFTLWAFIWFCIGKHMSKDFAIKKSFFKQKYPLLKTEELNRAFTALYKAKIAKSISFVFFCAVPFYLAANVKGAITLKNTIYCGCFMIISIVLFLYSKSVSNNNKFRKGNE